MHQLPNSSVIKFDLYQLHKSFGLSILALALFRLGWRLTHRAPALPTAMPGWQKLAARGLHWVFYALMILTPLAGWAIVSVSPTDIPTKWFGIFTVPHLPFFGGETSRALEDMMEERHEILAFAILYLLALHVAAALKHQFFDKDGVMSSIIPEKKRHWMGAGAIVAVLAAGALFYLAAPSARPAPAERALPSHSHDHKDSSAPANAGASSIEHSDDGHEHQAVEAEKATADAVAVDSNAAVLVETPSSDEHSHSAVWAVDYGASALKFTGLESGAKFEGVFSDFTAAISFDPDDLANATISVSVSTVSASTGNELRDSSLPGSEWFDVKNHPTATFTSTSVRKVGAGYEADGALTIKNFKRPVTLEFSLDNDGHEAVAIGHVNLVRTDFGLGEASSWLDEEGVGLEVGVEFEIHATRSE